jgi:predicted nucleic acid-binding protein
MQPNSNIIILDTSCLILLNKIGELNLLNKFINKIYITSIIKEEFGKNLPDWILIKNPSDIHYQKIIEMELDKGEASAIALGLEEENAILIIDDLKGRKVVEKLKIRYSGTFGLILKAKQIGLIKNVKPILEKIRLTNFRFSTDLFDTILAEAGE